MQREGVKETPTRSDAQRLSYRSQVTTSVLSQTSRLKESEDFCDLWRHKSQSLRCLVKFTITVIVVGIVGVVSDE